MVGGASFGHPFYDSGLGPFILAIPSAIRFELEKCVFDGDSGGREEPPDGGAA